MPKTFKKDSKMVLSYRLDVRNVTEEGIVEGYASVFDVVDSYKTAIKKGAFAESLAEKGASGIKVLYQHDPDDPIGVCLDAREDSVGLYVKTQLILSVQQAKDVFELIKAGALDSFSIGFMILEDSYNRETGVIDITKVDLWEYSIVTFPANKLAMVSNFRKNILETPDEEDGDLEKLSSDIKSLCSLLDVQNSLNRVKSYL